MSFAAAWSLSGGPERSATGKALVEAGLEVVLEKSPVPALFRYAARR
jgi:hypothetical protein